MPVTTTPEAAPAQSSRRYFFPLGGAYTWGSPFGPRTGGFHNGQDLPAVVGTPLLAVTAGNVTHTQSQAGGMEANLDVPGPDGTTIRYYYCHLSRNGQSGPVMAGDVIGYVGMSGNTSGPHLHFSLFRGGVAIDPAPFLRSIESNRLDAAAIAPDDASGITTVGFDLPNPLGALSQGQHLIDVLSDGETWLRILTVAFGLGLTAVGVRLVFKDLIAAKLAEVEL